jgi:hypothetical protein
MQMRLASSPAFQEPLLAAMPQLSEKPRQGVRSKNPAWHPGFNVCNSTAAIGLQFRSSGIVSGTVVAPNNGTPTKQPTSPVVKLICQQQAKAYQAKFNAANSGNVTAGAVGGGMAGVGIGVTTTSSFFTPIAFAEWLNLKWNSALSNTAYEVGYEQCISGNYN